jgi:hypothetical protein
MLRNYTLKKFLGLYILILLLIPVTVIISNPKNNLGDTRSKAMDSFGLNFWPSSAIFEKGKEYTITLKTTGKQIPNSIDLVLSFNPGVVKILGTGIIPGDIYTTYHKQLLDNQKGLVGIGGTDKTVNNDIFISLKLLALNQGPANFAIDYISIPEEKISIEPPKYEVR